MEEVLEREPEWPKLLSFKDKDHNQENTKITKSNCNCKIYLFTTILTVHKVLTQGFRTFYIACLWTSGMHCVLCWSCVHMHGAQVKSYPLYHNWIVLCCWITATPVFYSAPWPVTRQQAPCVCTATLMLIFMGFTGHCLCGMQKGCYCFKPSSHTKLWPL